MDKVSSLDPLEFSQQKCSQYSDYKYALYKMRNDRSLPSVQRFVAHYQAEAMAKTYYKKCVKESQY